MVKPEDLGFHKCKDAEDEYMLNLYDMDFEDNLGNKLDKLDCINMIESVMEDNGYLLNWLFVDDFEDLMHEVLSSKYLVARISNMK